MSHISVFRILPIIYASIIAIAASSCSGNGSGSATFSLDTIGAVAGDTLVTSRSWDDLLADSACETPTDTAVVALTPEEQISEPTDSDKYARGIIPQMLIDNPDYARRLLASTHPYFIVVDKPSMHVVLFDRFGRKVHAYKMACGKNFGQKHQKRDCRTPEGFFEAGDTYDSTDWLYTDDDGVTSPKKGQFGPRFIRVKNPISGQIGIHGTCAPWSLGRRASHGCIRIHNDNIVELVKYVTPGMPIIVNPARRDQAINLGEDCKVGKIYIGQVSESRKPIKPIVPQPEEKPDTAKAPAPADTTAIPAAPAPADTAAIEISPELMD